MLMIFLPSYQIIPSNSIKLGTAWSEMFSIPCSCFLAGKLVRVCMSVYIYIYRYIIYIYIYIYTGIYYIFISISYIYIYVYMIFIYIYTYMGMYRPLYCYFWVRL